MQVTVKSISRCMHCKYPCMIDIDNVVTCGCDDPNECDNVKDV